MREIGGYLEFESLTNKEYYPNAIALNTARNALVYLAKAKSIAKVYIPHFLCDSVYKVCDREQIPYEFYHIDEQLQPIFDKELIHNEYLYIVNYYGQLSVDKIREYKQIYKNIIVDNVQAFFAPSVNGVDTLYSCRKFFGVSDGAYLVTDANLLDLPTDRSGERVKHLFGRFESECASNYYNDSLANEATFESAKLMNMSKLTRNILGAIDYQSVIERRNKNWEFLHAALKDKNKLNLTFSSGPYMYPFYCLDAKKIRAELIREKIYIPVLWPNVKDSQANSFEKDLAENILPIPVDQRYTTEDMQIILDKLF